MFLMVKVAVWSRVGVYSRWKAMYWRVRRAPRVGGRAERRQEVSMMVNSAERVDSRSLWGEKVGKKGGKREEKGRKKKEKW